MFYSDFNSKDSTKSRDDNTIRPLKRKIDHINLEKKHEKFNVFKKIWINLIYFLIGHILISINIYYQNYKNEFILFSLLLYQLPFFFYQMLIKILIFFIYIIKYSFKSFLLEFYDNMRMEKDEQSFLHDITIDTYYVFAFLLFATYFAIFRITKDYILWRILGIAISVFLWPLILFINLIFLTVIIFIKKYDSFDILSDIKKILHNDD